MQRRARMGGTVPGEFGCRVLATERIYAPQTKNRSRKGIEKANYKGQMMKWGSSVGKTASGADLTLSKDGRTYVFSRNISSLALLLPKKKWGGSSRCEGHREIWRIQWEWGCVE
ncbi:hypothetical protein B0H13DRAFT_1861032 [Mycena leptocephala]|nr:hypothetical protein B0H13DRAFT_1861032 [Mycena leptocephala]